MAVLNMQEETMQYLYSEGNTIHLLNPETFDQIEMSMSACEAGEDGAAMLEGILDNNGRDDEDVLCANRLVS